MKTSILKLILSLNLIAATPCWAVDGGIPIRGFQIAQERTSNNGVLVSRPSKIDVRIVEIMGQNGVRTIEDYALWLANNMVYEREAKHTDQWLDPAEFLKTRRGDCEDFAILNQNVLRVLGYKAHIVTLNSDQSAHAICAFQYNGRFYWFDNAQLKTSTAFDLNAFAQEVTDQLNYTSSFELDPLSKQANLIYQRS